MSLSLETLVTEARKRGLWVGIEIHPQETLLDGVIISVEEGPDKLGMTTEISKASAATVEEAARRVLDDAKWQSPRKKRKAV